MGIYKDFPDFIMPPITCIGNALLTFGFVFQYEKEFEHTLINGFEAFLNNVSFLFASLQIDIENKKYFFIEYVSDGKEIHKSINTVLQSS